MHSSKRNYRNTMYGISFKNRFNTLSLESVSFGKQITIGNYSTVYRAGASDVSIQKKIKVAPNQLWYVQAGYGANWNSIRTHDHDWLHGKVAHDFISKYLKLNRFNAIENLCGLGAYFEIMDYSFEKIKKYFKSIGPVHPSVLQLLRWIEIKAEARYKVCASRGYYLYKNSTELRELHLKTFYKALNTVEKTCSLKSTEKQLKEEELFRRIRLARGITLEEQEKQRAKNLKQTQLINRENMLKFLKRAMEAAEEKIAEQSEVNEVGYLYFESYSMARYTHGVSPTYSKWMKTAIGLSSDDFVSVCDSSVHELMKLEGGNYYSDSFANRIRNHVTPEQFQGLKVGKSVGGIFAKLFSESSTKQPNDFQKLYLYYRKCEKTGVVLEFIISKHQAQISRSK